MFKRKTIMRKLRLAGIIAIALFIMSGCGYTNKKQQISNPHSAGKINVQQTAPAEPLINNASEIAAHLEGIAMRVPNVRNAHCVVVGNTAVIGIDIDANLDRSKVGTIKYSVAEALQKDPLGKNSIVTADIDLNQRIREIRESIMAGRPFSGFANEMADIVSRIIPQFPGDIIQGGNIVPDAGRKAPGQEAPARPTAP